MPRAGFEPTIRILERLKTVRALDGAVIGTGTFLKVFMIILVLSLLRK
jgi:hypothetical protein